MSKYPLGSNLGGTGDWGGDWGFRVGIGFRLSGFKVVHIRNKGLSMSKYPLGSNLGRTGDSGGDWNKVLRLPHNSTRQPESSQS